MRIFCLILSLMLCLFVYFQFNDPDGPLWVIFYGIPAIWTMLAAARPQKLTGKLTKFALAACILLASVAMIYYWPKSSGWWKKDVWWEVESAREGMGMMISLFCLVMAWLTVNASSKHLPATTHSGTGGSGSGNDTLKQQG